MKMEWHKANEKFNGLIRQLFHGESWKDRAEAARELGFMKDARATNLLCRALRKEEEDQMVFNRIIEALGRIGDKKATMRIIEKLEEELNKFEGNKYSVVFIIESLTKLKDKRALPYLSPFLQSSDDDLRYLTEKAFDAILPDWRTIIEKKKKTHWDFDVGEALFRKHRFEYIDVTINQLRLNFTVGHHNFHAVIFQLTCLVDGLEGNQVLFDFQQG